MGAIIKTVQNQHILDHLLEANEYWVAAFPGVYDEIAEAIVEAKKKKPELKIELIIDPSEEAFRSHHGSIDAIHWLQHCDIPIKQIPNHRLGFFMSEQSGWIVFPQSRAIEKDPPGVNALRMNDLTKQELYYYFFDRKAEPEFILNYSPPEIYGEQHTPEEIDDEAFDKVSESIAHNPPPSPDFKRIIDVYSTKIKFIEFKVNGIQIDQQTVTIPNDILNISDEDLRRRIRTRLNMFEGEDRERVKAKFAKVDAECDSIRSELLKRVKSRDKSALRSVDLNEYNRRIANLKRMYETIKDEVDEDIRLARISLKKRLESELIKIFTENPPAHLEKYKNTDNYEMHIQNHASEKVNKINIPTVERFFNRFEVISRIFDPTYEDFSDTSFIEELVDIGFISQAERAEIVDEAKAIATQKDERD